MLFIPLFYLPLVTVDIKKDTWSKERRERTASGRLPLSVYLVQGLKKEAATDKMNGQF